MIEVKDNFINLPCFASPHARPFKFTRLCLSHVHHRDHRHLWHHLVGWKVPRRSTGPRRTHLLRTIQCQHLTKKWEFRGALDIIPTTIQQLLAHTVLGPKIIIWLICTPVCERHRRSRYSRPRTLRNLVIRSIDPCTVI